MKSIRSLILFSTAMLLSVTAPSWAQEKDTDTDTTQLDTEVVEIVKPYTPDVADAFKIKEQATLSDTITEKQKRVDYTISSVPVASTFTPAKGKAATIERAKKEELYDNYARVGFGNYTALLAEFYTNFDLSTTDALGLSFRHNSTQGGIKNVILDDKFYDTRLAAHYSSRQQQASYTLDFGLDHQQINWYGLPKNATQYFTSEDLIALNPAQNYFGGYVGGEVSMKESVFDKARAELRYLGDSFSSSEFQAKLAPEFVFSFDDLAILIDADVDFLSGSFDRSFSSTDKINYGFLNLGIAPALVFGDETVSVRLGVAGYLGMDTENSTSEFSLYPRVKASYRIDESAIVYAGADGGLKQNSYYNFKEANPFISPTLMMLPTKNTYDGFAGIRGKISDVVDYNLKASYGNEVGKALFKSNPIHSMGGNEKAYQYGNSFQVVYDEISTLSISGSVATEISEMVTLGLDVTYSNYSTDIEDHAWNLPDLEATLYSEFDINDQLYGGASIYFVGARKDYDFQASKAITLDSFVDANLHFGYRITPQFTAFVKGSNLFGDTYHRWKDYPVQGIQVMAGLAYKFDW